MTDEYQRLVDAEQQAHARHRSNMSNAILEYAWTKCMREKIQYERTHNVANGEYKEVRHDERNI